MSKSDIVAKIRSKEIEIEVLKREIAELKRLIAVDENTQEVFRASKEEQVKIFTEYFKGRDDVFAYLSFNKNDPSIKYYTPACENEWNKLVCNKTMKKSCKTCNYRSSKPLTFDIYRNHIFGNKPVGLYPLLDDDSCYFLAFDFDDKKNENNIKEDLLVFWNVCDTFNLPIAVERSRSGKGFHVWLFFSDKIKAYVARRLGSLLLSKTMESRDDFQISSFDRMFPNQDLMPKGGYGNLILLPFQHEARGYNNSIFIDKNFLPINGQIKYLKDLKKMSLYEVNEIIEIISNQTINISDENLDIKAELKNINKNNIEFPKEISVVLDDMVYIDKANLNSSVRNSFRKMASFHNPEFYKKQRLRMSTYNVPLVIDCSKADDKHIKLPRGTFEYLEELCSVKKIKMNVTDKRNTGIKNKLVFNGNLRSEQKDCLNALMKFDNGILHAPTGFGKTVVACNLIAKRRVNTLIIVNKIELMRQWKESLQKFLDLDNVGQIGGGKKVVTNLVDVASIQTLWNDGKINDIVKNYGMIIVDECHHLAAYTYEGAINSVNAKYVYGFTATPNRENGHTPIIKMQCGDIRYNVDFKKFNKNLGIPMKVIVEEVTVANLDLSINDYSLNEINEMISKDEKRSDRIIENIKKEYLNKKNILVLTERLELLEYFQVKLSEFTNNLFVYRGGLGKKTLKIYNESKKRIKTNNENKIIIATGSYIGEGFDDNSLDVMFLTMPISGITKVMQYTGRLHRKNDDKSEILVYDYVDKNFRQTRSMFEKRKKTYEKLGYDIIDNRVQPQIIEILSLDNENV